MAELVAGDGTRLPLRVEGSSIVGRHSDDGTFKPDVDLEGIEGGRTVSRQHARIYVRDGQWRLRVEPTTTNLTVVAGQPLGAGQEATLNDGDEIRLGALALVFSAGAQAIAATLEEAAVAMQPTAQLVGEDTTIPLAARDGGELSIGRHSEDGSHRPDVDLGDLPYGRTVSRRHGKLRYRGEQWFLRVEADSTNETLLDGNPLPKGQDVQLAEGNRLQFGRVVVVFRQVKKIPSVGPDQIEVIVEPAQLTVAAGNRTEATITVINHTGHVDWFKVELEGVPEEWYQLIPVSGPPGPTAQVQLFHTPAHAEPSSDAVAELRVVFSPPRSPQSRAGVHPIVFSATTQGEPQARRATAGRLTIEPYEVLEMTVQPEEIEKPRGDYSIDLHNGGNDIATVALAFQGAANLLFECQRPQLQLNPDGRDRVKVRVRVKRRHWLGSSYPEYFTVNASAGEQAQMGRSVLRCPPRIPWWLQTAIARVQGFLAPIAIIVVLAIGFFVFARPAEIKEFKADPATVISGTPVTLAWKTERGSGVAMEPSSGSEELKVPEGSLKVTPDQNTKYTLTVRNLIGITSSKSIDVEVKPAPTPVPAPKILVFSVTPEQIKKEGEPVTLRWQTDGVTKVSFEPADVVKDPQPSGETTVHPDKNNEVYKIVAVNEAGQKVEASKTVAIEPPQVLSFTASAPSVVQGAEVRLRWSAQGYTKLTLKADKGEIAPGQQEVSPPDSVTELAVQPTEDTTYTLTVSNAAGSVPREVQVKVAEVGSPKIDFFTAAPTSIVKGEGEAILSFSAQNVKKVTIQGSDGKKVGEWNVDKPYSKKASVTVSPEKTTVYTLTVSNGSEETAMPATVEVKAPPTPAPEPPKPSSEPPTP